MENASKNIFPVVLGKEVSVKGRFLKVASIRSEYFENIDDPNTFVRELKKSNIKASVFTFTDGVAYKKEREGYQSIGDSKAVVRIDSYEDWWKKTINDKTRNMVRKAGKKGVDIKIVEYDAELVKGIHAIYNEAPLRQGRPFPHYGMTLEKVEESNKKFNERSDFIGAYWNNELIGFVKLVHMEGYSAFMQIISKIEHRDKAPTNALLAKAVEICAERNVPYLMYGMWSRRTLGYFKKHHGFKRMVIPKYYVPLTVYGRIALLLRFHYPFTEKIIDLFPDKWILTVTTWRNKWYLSRLKVQAT